MTGVTLGNAETMLTQRAADFLAAGPAHPQALISYVCKLPGAPSNVAEHMASALFAGHQKFVRASDGRWMLRDAALTAHPVESHALDTSECATSALHGESFVV